MPGPYAFACRSVWTVSEQKSLLGAHLDALAQVTSPAPGWPLRPVVTPTDQGRNISLR